MIVDAYYKLRRSLLDPLSWQLSKAELHRLFALADTNAIIAGAFGYTGRGYYRRIAPSQYVEELGALAKLVKDRKPRGIVEIGTAAGGTLFVWSRTFAELERIVSVDLPGGKFGGGYHPMRQKLYQEFVADKPRTKMTLFQTDSHATATRDLVGEAMGGVPIDFLFIDGDHTYEGVKHDFELYEPLVAPGGIIAFHDILPQKFLPEFGVDRFWHEAKQGRTHHEFIRDPQQGRMGIGALVKS